VTEREPGTNPWAAIVGRQDDGREDVAGAVVTALRRRGLRVGGFLQRPVRPHGGRMLGWDATDLASGEVCVLARESDDPDLCDWRFDPDAVRRCRRWACGDEHDVVVLEAGSLEASGRGHWETLRAVLRGPPRLVVLCLRPRPAPAIALELPDPAAGIELPAEGGAVDAFVEERVRAAPSP